MNTFLDKPGLIKVLERIKNAFNDIKVILNTKADKGSGGSITVEALDASHIITFNEDGAHLQNVTIPKQRSISSFTNDSGYQTASQVETAINNRISDLKVSTTTTISDVISSSEVYDPDSATCTFVQVAEWGNIVTMYMGFKPPRKWLAGSKHMLGLFNNNKYKAVYPFLGFSSCGTVSFANNTPIVITLATDMDNDTASTVYAVFIKQ